MKQNQKLVWKNGDGVMVVVAVGTGHGMSLQPGMSLQYAVPQHHGVSHQHGVVHHHGIALRYFPCYRFGICHGKSLHHAMVHRHGMPFINHSGVVRLCVIKCILLPFGWVVQYVICNIFKRLWVANNVVVKTRLPLEIFVMVLVAPSFYRRFVLVYDG